MKKLRVIAIVLFVMLSGVIFSACTENYKRLDMSFYFGDDNISSVTLYIDDTQNESKELSVRLTGIKQDAIGEISVNADQSGVVQITNQVLDGNTYYFTVTANKPTKGAKLVVNHLASNKTASIDLNIERKSNGINLHKNQYVITLPNEGTRATDIVVDDKLLTLNPLESTDQVYFKLASRSLPTGVSIGENQSVTVGEENLITGFTCSYRVVDGTELLVYPVTVMEGYETTVYTANPITIKFARTLQEDELELSSANAGFNQALTNGKDITLLWNDEVDANYIEVSLSTNSLVGLDHYLETTKLYSSNVKVIIGDGSEYDNALFTVTPLGFTNGEFKYKIIANRWTDATKTIKFVLVANEELAGEINNVSVALNLVSKSRVKSIGVYQDDVLRTPSATTSLDLYNYYQNGFGSKFQFELDPADVLDDFKKMHITLPASMLNANFNDGGVNPVYEDYNFDRIVDNKGYFGNNDVKSNATLLNIYLNSSPLKFYYQDGRFVSEDFEQNDIIYLMYTNNQQSLASNVLQLNVEAYYSGELEYLKNTTPTQRLITFNNQEGVRSFDVEVGKWDGGNFVYFDNHKNPDTLYFDRSVENSNYGFIINNVLGASVDGTKPISNTDFNVSIVSGNKTNPIKLYVDRISNNEEFENPYEYQENKSLFLIFALTETTDVGDYYLRITHANGVVKQIKLVVYQKLTENDVNLNLTGNYIVNNDAGKVYYDNYQENSIIVAVGERLNLSVDIDDIWTNEYILGYTFQNPFASLDEMIAPNYLKLSAEQKTAALDFLAGTYYAGTNQYINLTITVQTQKYSEMFVEEGKTEEVSLTLTFFIYVKATNTSLKLTADTIRWADDSLAYNLKENSVTTINATLADDVYNYILTLPQADNGLGVAGDYKIVWDVTSSMGGEVNTLSQTNNSLGLQFVNLMSDASSFTYCFRATITQFNSKYYSNVYITVLKPILTEQLIVDNLLYTEDLGNYVNVEAGGSYTVEAQNYSSAGTVTNPGFAVYLAYINNGLYNYTTNYNNIVYIDGNTIRINQIDADAVIDNLKVVVFAKDVLTADPVGEQTRTLDALMNIIINGQRLSYMVFDLVISTGAEDNPYLITTATDLAKLNNTNNVVYYQIMNDINLANFNTAIENVNANITTLNDNKYSLYGLTLNNSLQNLFTNFGGKLENVTFNVNYNYNSVFASGTNLGVFGENNGILTDVSVEFNGSASLDGNSNTIYFGGLVGKNIGEIKYTINMVENTGNITITGGSVTFFGGLVGLNTDGGSVVGYKQNNNVGSVDAEITGGQNIVFDRGSLTGTTINVEINSSRLTNANSAVGGLVGLNNSQNANAVRDVTTTGKIDGANNLGGVIGNNNLSNSSAITFTTTYDFTGHYINKLEYTSVTNVYNVTSSVVITGSRSLGGIVGKDEKGRYKYCNYQILSQIGTAIQGTSEVGGIAGQSTNGLFEYCSVMSYRWDYKQLNSAFNNNTADIVGGNNVGGAIGYAVSSTSAVSGGETKYVNGAVLVNATSVNAYVQAGSYSNLGGLITMANGLGFITNSYFMGKLSGRVNEDCELANNSANVYFNTLYAVYVNGDANSITDKRYPTQFNIKGENESPWAYDENLNGGYIYLTNEYGKPLFDVAPTGLTATVDIKNNGTQENSAYKLNDNTVLLEYYLFDLDETDANYVATLNTLNNRFNTYNILDLIKFEALPNTEALKTIHLTANSSNNNVLEIVGDKFIVRGVGSTTVTFTSVLNAQCQATINVQTMYPMGNEFKITSSSTSLAPATELTIQLNKSAILYLNYTGKIEGLEYNYYTNANYKLLLTTSANLTTANADRFITIRDAEFKLDEETGLYTAIINPYLNLTALNAGGEINLTITPILLSADGEIILTDTKNTHTIKITTATGPTDVHFSLSSAVVYPDFAYPVSVNISTDLEQTIIDDANWFNGTDLNNVGYFELLINLADEWQVVKDYTNYIELDYVGYSWDETIKQQKLNFNLRFKTTENEQPIEFMLRFNVPSVDNTLTTFVNYTLLPQRVEGLNIKNYIYTSTDIEQTNTIQPYGNGLIIIDTVPVTGYYDYLEIRDITGQEEIMFAQIDGVGGNRLSNYDTPTADGLGIRLIKVAGEDGKFASRMFVATAISSSYASIPHTVEVRAYLNDGTLVAQPTTIRIDVRMLPGVQVTYFAPNGSVVWSEDTTATRQENLAVGTNATFRVTTSNSDGNVDYEINIIGGNAGDNGLYTINYIGNNYYKLQYLGTVDDANRLLNENKKLKIVWSTTSTLTNGAVETGKTEVTFKFVPFVVHGVSVTNSRSTANGDEVYGNFGQTIPFEFYFTNTDISYYDNGDDSLTYRISDIETELPNAGSLGAIYSILTGLNSGEYLTWISEDENYSTAELNENVADLGVVYSIENKTLTVTKNKLTGMSLAFNLVKNADTNNFEIATYDLEEEAVHFQKGFALNFASATTEFEPDLIRNEDEFINMAMGAESNYILADDLVLTNYTPMSLDVHTFDGNGHTITIKSFAPFTGTDIEAGLFTEITETTMLMNLQVNYDLENVAGNPSKITPATANGFIINNYYHLGADGYSYNSAKAGGIAVTNNGKISNCKVVGTFAVETPALEVTDREIGFNIGGFVATNANTGYITNSVSELKIAAMANVGGFVAENTGKIVASYFDASANLNNEESKGLIYIYYGNQTIDAVKVNSAGFAIQNSGQILMSYVDIGYSVKTEDKTAVMIGNMSTKDESAGFVFTNGGAISNCYIQMQTLGSNSNTFNGFVTQNSGNISNVYAYINGGEATNNANLFAPRGISSVENSFIIIDNNELESTTNGIEGLNVICEKDMYSQASYNNWLFGDNANAVWVIKNGLPQLVATGETTPFKAPNSYVVTTNGNITTYDGFKAITEESSVDTNGVVVFTKSVDYSNYGTKDYPYLIYDVHSWNTYFNNNNRTSYYRLVADINFESTRPESSTLNFQGNIQGNGMNISNILLYTQESLNAVGLFATMESNTNVVNAVRNVNLLYADVKAIKTQAVGTLAGVITGYKLYNITVDSSSTILGNNAVGGLAGVIRGNFNVEKVYSNVSVNSAYTASAVSYDVYLSRNNNRTVSANLKDVSYSGSLFGIADGYADGVVNNNRTVNNYSYIQDVTIEGGITAIGNTVGSTIGLVGELAYLKNVSVEISGYKLGGYQYSGGVVGENRGILDNADVTYTAGGTSGLFDDSYTTVGGIVGLNLGGLVMNSDAEIDIIKANTFGSTSVVAGIVGRNIAGSVYNCYYNGRMMNANSNSFEVTAGIVGAMYSARTARNYTAGLNKISLASEGAIPTETPVYRINTLTNTITTEPSNVKGVVDITEDIVNSTVSANTIKYWLQNLNRFYTYGTRETDDFNYSLSLSAYRVLGLAVGVMDENSNAVDETTKENKLINTYSNFVNNLHYGLDQNGNLVVNGNCYVNDIATFDCNMYNGARVKTPFVNVLSLSTLNAEGTPVKDLNYMCYMVGLSLGGYDSWDKSTLNGEKVMITNATEGINVLEDNYKDIGKGKNSVKLLKEVDPTAERKKYETNVTYLYIAGDTVYYKLKQDVTTFLKIDFANYISSSVGGYVKKPALVGLDETPLGDNPLDDGTTVIYEIQNNNFEIAKLRNYTDEDNVSHTIDVVRLKFKAL